jgi:uncharacterized membrane protein
VSVPTIISDGVAWFLVCLFVQAAWHKLGAPEYYRRLMTRYAGRPGGGIAVWLVALLEAYIALSLLLPESRAAGLAAAAGLLLAYGGLMAWQLLRGESNMQCGCAGPDSQLGVSWALVVRNGVCAGLALLAMTAGVTADAGWIGLVISLFVALFALLVYETSEQLISNAQWMAGEG